LKIGFFILAIAKSIIIKANRSISHSVRPKICSWYG
jgi:hypothetical protein